jgi:hypothetical protein
MNWLRKSRGEITMGGLFIVFLMVVFALALTPTIGDNTYSILWNSTNVTNRIPNNITGGARDVIALTPLIWVFIVIGIGAAAVVAMFQDIN